VDKEIYSVQFAIKRERPTVCVSGLWASVDNAWEQKKTEARKMLVNRADSHKSTARFVGRFLLRRTRWLKQDKCTLTFYL